MKRILGIAMVLGLVAFIAGCSKEKAAQIFGFNPEMKTILIFGGSLGARSINHAVVKHIDFFEKNSIQVLWQTGTSFSVPVDLPPNIHTLPFIDDMISAYAASDSYSFTWGS